MKILIFGAGKDHIPLIKSSTTPPRGSPSGKAATASPGPQRKEAWSPFFPGAREPSFPARMPSRSSSMPSGKDPSILPSASFPTPTGPVTETPATTSRSPTTASTSRPTRGSREGLPGKPSVPRPSASSPPRRAVASPSSPTARGRNSSSVSTTGRSPAGRMPARISSRTATGFSSSTREATPTCASRS